MKIFTQVAKTVEVKKVLYIEKTDGNVLSLDNVVDAEILNGRLIATINTEHGNGYRKKIEYELREIEYARVDDVPEDY